jgi:hypothetical protein
MPYKLMWEPSGLYRQYFGDVTIAERRASFNQICADPRFDQLRYSITDYLAVEGFETTAGATEELAAFHIAPLLTNPRVVIAAVATRPDIVADIQAFISHGFTSRPYRVFATLDDARHWVSTVTR